MVGFVDEDRRRRDEGADAKRGRVDKLETILAAEEAARHTVADARDRAAAVRAQATAEARHISESKAQSATAEAAAGRERLVSAAQTEADAVLAAADKERAALLAGARMRVDGAAAAVVRTLRG